MKRPSIPGVKTTIFLVLLLSVFTALPACGSSQAQTTKPDNTTSLPASVTTTASATATGDPFIPPTPAELAALHYVSPELPRITCEQIKKIIDEAQAAGRFAGRGGMTRWEDFIIIDVRISGGEVNGTPGFSQPGHILGARSMPMTWYWTTDPREDPKAEEVDAYKQELIALDENIALLPKGLPIYIYDGTADDEAACIVAEKVIAAGFDPQSVWVIYGGFGHWYYDLQYPIYQGDYNFSGE